MAYYKSPEEMYSARAKDFRAKANDHWAKAKTGQGGFHYAEAKELYKCAAHNEELAKMAHDTHATFAKHKKK